ncbi:uncharacterized protein BCR38DRAFT_410333 [Pseudomassariella vexata]|uniref:Uncharacterized protein n=1 Tax=Pseudomassariella vexata TaxID=1141098 RepID=A0A1Y2DWC2_9PEZI|nr:uncharacterized protein BCR38DRAFT_410333 [Pseudomassariella vexata]ORY63404.1 hypothetical protein BCR38DRAFT_410333 [Pseudomassariella vexata]
MYLRLKVCQKRLRFNVASFDALICGAKASQPLESWVKADFHAVVATKLAKAITSSLNKSRPPRSRYVGDRPSRFSALAGAAQASSFLLLFPAEVRLLAQSFCCTVNQMFGGRALSINGGAVAKRGVEQNEPGKRMSKLFHVSHQGARLQSRRLRFHHTAQSSSSRRRAPRHAFEAIGRSRKPLQLRPGLGARAQGGTVQELNAKSFHVLFDDGPKHEVDAANNHAATVQVDCSVRRGVVASRTPAGG